MLNLIIIPSLDFLTLNPCVDSKKGHMQLAWLAASNIFE